MDLTAAACRLRRRLRLALAAGVLLPFAALIGLPGAAGGAAVPTPLPAWLMFQHGATHTGLQPRETSLSATTVKGLKRLWSAPAQTDSAVLPEPLGTSGAPVETVVTSTATGLVSYLGRSGRPLWNSHFPGSSSMQTSGAVAAEDGLASSPPTRQDLVFAGFSGGGSTAVEAVDALDGKVVWSDPWPSKGGATCAPPRASIESPLTVSGGIVYGQTSGGCVFALDASNGSVVWVANSAPGASLSGQTSPAVVPTSPGVPQSELAVGDYAGDLVILSAATGSVLFPPVAGCGDGESSPSASGAVIYSAGSRGLCAVDAVGGVLKWAQACGAGSLQAPAVAGSELYIAGASGTAYTGKLCSVSSSGALRWSAPVGGEASSAAIADGVVYVAVPKPGLLEALDAGSGALLWRHSATLGAWSSPVVADGWVYAGGNAFSLAPASCASGWTRQLESTASGQLLALAPASRTDAWAVGDAPGTSRTSTLVEHWDGSKWTRVASPSPSRGFDLLSGVAAAGSSDAWAVGGEQSMSGLTASTLIEHWTGTKWLTTGSPDPSKAGNELFAVAVAAKDSVWAVGADDVSSFRGPARTLVLHWNGMRWSTVPSPDPASYNLLSGVSTIPGSAALWAVGSKTTASGVVTPLVERWNGSKWTVTRAPSLSGGALAAVTAISPKEAWAVGSIGSRPLVLGWNGSAWSRARLPTATGRLVAVSAQSTARAWAVGGGLILQWTGASWVRVSWSRPSHAVLDAVAVASGKAPSGWTAWVAGSWSSSQSPLVVYRCS